MDAEFVEVEENQEECMEFIRQAWRETLREIARQSGKIAYFDWDGIDTRERIYPEHAEL